MKKILPLIFVFVTFPGPALYSYSFERMFTAGFDLGVQRFQEFPAGLSLVLTGETTLGLQFPEDIGALLYLGSGYSTQGVSASPITYRQTIHLGFAPEISYTLSFLAPIKTRILLGPEFRTWLYFKERAFTYSTGFRLELQLLAPSMSPNTELTLGFPVNYQKRDDGSWSLGTGLRIGFNEVWL